MTTTDNSDADCCTLVSLKTNSTLPNISPRSCSTGYNQFSTFSETKQRNTFSVTVLFFGAVPAGLNRMFY